jgi:hypothetical protein
MPIDVSMYNQEPVDPMAAIGKTVGVANQLTQNRILGTQSERAQAELAADQAVGSAAQNNMLANGTLNQAGFGAAVAADPRAGMRALSALQTGGTVQGQSLSNQGTGVVQAQQRQDNFAAKVGALGPNPTRQDVLKVASDMLHQGQLIPDDTPGILGEIPMKPADVADYARRKVMAAHSAQQQTAQTPAGVGPDGAPLQAPLATVVRQQAAAPSGAIPSALPPGQGDVMANDEKSYQADQQGAASIMKNARPLQAALPLIERLNNHSFGPGSKQFNKIKGALQFAGIIPPGTTDTEVRQEANKYFHNYAASTGGAGRSDQALSQAAISNPSMELTQGANLDLIKSQIGRDRMDASLASAFKAQNPNVKGGAGYSDFKSRFYQQNDPRAFSYDLLDPAGKQKVLNSIGKPGSDAYNKFGRSLKLAHEAGMLQMPPPPSATTPPAGAQ